jgi:hypothetical protein
LKVNHNEQHNTPHIHAKFQDFSASFAIESGEKLAGDFPIGKARMVQAWIEINREALIAELYGFSEGCSGGRGGSIKLNCRLSY